MAKLLQMTQQQLNIVLIVISKGNLPLQGTKQFVRIAISRSLGESIIRQPIIPAALQPRPIHIVRDCLPQALHFLKQRSKQKAILGSNPESSISVNKGKKIAIGGSITEIIQPRTRNTPLVRNSLII